MVRYCLIPILDLDQQLHSAPFEALIVPRNIGSIRRARFNDRLNARLDDLAILGQPELPRLVSHTLRLLRLLRDSYSPVPPPAISLDKGASTLGMDIYGEPTCVIPSSMATTSVQPAGPPPP